MDPVQKIFELLKRHFPKLQINFSEFLEKTQFIREHPFYNSGVIKHSFNIWGIATAVGLTGREVWTSEVLLNLEHEGMTLEQHLKSEKFKVRQIGHGESRHMVTYQYVLGDKSRGEAVASNLADQIIRAITEAETRMLKNRDDLASAKASAD